MSMEDYLSIDPASPTQEKSLMNDYTEDEIQDFAENEAENDYEANKL